jgi:tetratricopeptide (TPR) repeat protein
MTRAQAAFCYLLALLWFCFPAAAAEQSLRALFEQGKSLVKSKQYDEAIGVFSRALDLSQTDTRNALIVMLARAEAYLDKGDLRHAQRDISTVLQSPGLEGETEVSALHLKAALSRRRGQDRQALKTLTEAIKVPHHSEKLRASSFANRGVILVNVGDPDRAVTDLNKAIELDPQSSFAYAVRGLANLRRDQIESARSDAETALSMNPDDRTRDIALKILQELSLSASGPLNLSVPMGENGQIYVQLRFGRKGKPHRFLLDTGATTSLIDRKLLKEVARDTTVTEFGRGVARTADGAAHKVIRYKVKNVFLFHLPLGEIEMDVFVSNKRRVMNLLGTRSLKSLAVSIDNARRKVEITRKDPIP